MTTKELKEKRAEIARRIKEMTDKISKENRAFTAEEQTNIDAAYADFDNLGKQLSAQERAGAVAAEMAAVSTSAAAQISELPAAQRANVPTVEDEALAIQGWMRSRRGDDLNEAHEAAAKKLGIALRSPELVLPFGQWLKRREALRNPAEARAMTVTTTGGGYLIPTGFSFQLEQSMLAFNPLEAVATQLVTTSGNDVHWPTANDTANAGEMVGINATTSEVTPTIGEVVFKAFKGSSGMVLVPTELIQDSAFDMSTFLSGALGERLGRLRAAQCATGAGTTAPTGIVTGAGAATLSSAQTSITADNIIDLYHSVDPAYRNPALGFGFMMNDAIVKYVRKLKDGEGRYLWANGLDGGSTATLMGAPVTISQAMASSIANTNRTIVCGALRKFVIRTAGEIRIRRLVERYAEYDQEGWVAWIRFDSNILDAGTDPIKCLAQGT